MGFRRTNEEQEAILQILQSIVNAEAPQSWEDHEEAVDEAEHGSHDDYNADVLPVSIKSLIEALGEAVQRTLDMLEAGTLAFENGNEMAATVHAVETLTTLQRHYGVGLDG